MLAQAQVEIYGRANVTVEHQSVKAHGNPATNDFSVNAVVDNSSRVGFRGKEDLGGGLSAFFQVESRVRLDEGTAGFWASRDSFVGLQSGSLGTLRLGRTIGPVYYATYDYISMHNHDTGTSADALLAPATVGNAGFMNNTIWYTSPKFGGFGVDVAYSFGPTGSENPVAQPLSNSQPQYIGIVGAYDQGPLHVALTYAETSKTQNLAAAPALKFNKDNAWTVAGLYDFKVVVVGALYERAESDLLVNKAKRDYFRVAVMVPVGPHEFHVNVGQVNHRLDIPVSDGATQWTLAYNYNLSKRTKVYGFYTKVDNSGNITTGGNYGFRTNLAAVDNSSFALGVRHNF